MIESIELFNFNFLKQGSQLFIYQFNSIQYQTSISSQAKSMTANIRNFLSEGTLGLEKEMFKKIIYEDFSRNMDGDLKKYQEYKRAKLKTLLSSKWEIEDEPEKNRQRIKQMISNYEIKTNVYNLHLLKEYQVQYKQKFGRDEEYFSEAFRTQGEQKKVQNKIQVKTDGMLERKQPLNFAKEEQKMEKKINIQDQDSVVQEKISSSQEDDNSSLDQNMADEDVGGFSSPKKSKKKNKKEVEVASKLDKEDLIQNQTMKQQISNKVKVAEANSNIQTKVKDSFQIQKQDSNRKEQDVKAISYENESDNESNEDMFIQDSIQQPKKRAKINEPEKTKSKKAQISVPQPKIIKMTASKMKEEKVAPLESQNNHDSQSEDMYIDEDAIHNSKSRTFSNQKSQKTIEKQMQPSPKKVDDKYTIKTAQIAKKIQVYSPPPSIQASPLKLKEKESNKQQNKPKVDIDEEDMIMNENEIY